MYVWPLCGLRTSLSTPKGSQTKSGPCSGGLEGVQFPRLLGRGKPDLDQVERADEPVTYSKASRPHDGVSQWHRPMVLEEDQRGCGVFGDVLEHVPGLLVGEGTESAVCCGLGAGGGAGHHSALTVDTEADQGA